VCVCVCVFVCVCVYTQVSAVRGTGENQKEHKLLVYESQRKLASSSSSHRNAGECVIIGNQSSANQRSQSSANQAPSDGIVCR
jgi:hypothetical protein